VDNGAIAQLEVRPGQPALRWSSRAHSMDEIQRELGQIWGRPRGDGSGSDTELHVAARSSVLNLVVIVRRPELGTRTAATIAQLTGRHPSRTLIIAATDPDGPSSLDAHIQAFCMVPRPGAPETCAEMIYLVAAGEAGRHLPTLVSPLLIHDLPVTLWLPGEPAFAGASARALLDMADRVLVDGSRWNGNGIGPLTELAALASGRLAISDFALIRQSRWREAIAATFDAPDYTPYLRSIRRIEVTYSTHDDSGDPAVANVVKPLYHAAWIAGRLGMHVISPLRPARTGSAAGQTGGFDATLRLGRSDVAVVLRPERSTSPEGTTLKVELVALRRGSELRAVVTAQAETVHCVVTRDGLDPQERRFHSPRRVDADLLATAIESTSDDHIERETIRMAARIVSPGVATHVQ
jgi:glucose-6-phosphate dehydrogenase assembly protein OpcA